DKQHLILNHNRMHNTYPGADGFKTGYTRKAGHTLIAAATRDGRTMMAIVMGAPDPYRSATSLMDRGFTTPVPAERALDKLPPVVSNAAVHETQKQVTSQSPAAAPRPPPRVP